MKHLAALLLAGALVALMLQPVTLAVNTLSGNDVVRADGGGPPPPFPLPPPPKGGLLADGGGPPPPFPLPPAPKGGLLADGGGPPPPFPPCAGGLFA